MASSTGRRRAVWVMTRPWAVPPEPTRTDQPDPYGNPDPEWLKIDWGEHRKTLTLPGPTPVNYVEIGTGPALLLVHGLSGCWQNWLENIPHLARSHRVIVPDLPGFGASPMPPWRISIRSYGQLLIDLCAALDTGPVVLVGNSMGGFISAELALSATAPIERLVLLSAAGVSHARMWAAPATTMARMAAAGAPLAFRYHERTLHRPALRRWLLRQVFYNPWALRDELLWEFAHHGINAPGFVAATRGLVGYDILERLEKVETPSLIVWGRNDLVVPPSDGIAYHELLRNSRLEIFDRCGHCPMAERPVRLNRLLDEFLGSPRSAGNGAL